jgi:hypothetical protein
MRAPPRALKGRRPPSGRSSMSGPTARVGDTSGSGRRCYGARPAHLRLSGLMRARCRPLGRTSVCRNSVHFPRPTREAERYGTCAALHSASLEGRPPRESYSVREARDQNGSPSGPGPGSACCSPASGGVCPFSGRRRPVPAQRLDPRAPPLLATGEEGRAREADSYLVDPASSHMLVSKIKPCMSKY